MTNLFSNLWASQRALADAEFQDEALQLLTDLLLILFEEATVRVTLGANGHDAPSTAVQEVIDNLAPILADDGRQFIIPLLAEGKALGTVCIDTSHMPTPAQIASGLALAQIAATTLDRLNWRATPYVFRQLVENANVAIDVADMGGSITYANRAAARMYGFDSPDEMIGRNVSELYDSDQEKLVASELIFHAHTADGWIGEVNHKHTNGRAFPVEIAVFGLHNPQHKIASYGAIIQNVSEYHRLLDTVRERARRSEALSRIGTVLSSSLDRNYILRVAAAQIAELLNVEHCSIAVIDETGQAADILAEFPPSSLSTFKISLVGNPIYEAHMKDQFFISPDVATDARLDPVRSTLTAFNVQSMMVIKLEVKGKIIGSIGVDSVSHRREFAQEDIEACRTLANQVGLAIENADLYAQAVEANKLKSQFLATMSHELRTPLNAILGYTEMVLTGIYGPLTDKQKDRLQRVFANGHNLLEMINDVLDLSKIEAGEMRLVPEPLELAPLVMSAIGNVAPQAEAKRLRLSVEIPANLPRVMADGGRLRQMVVNLLGNAVKFTREGSVTARIYLTSTADNTPTISAEPSAGRWIAIAVEDTGIGISPENFDIIFDAFRQVDGSTVREYSGTGLGLAITRQLAELQGGRLWVQSEVGRGSVFTFTLPAAPDG